MAFAPSRPLFGRAVERDQSGVEGRLILEIHAQHGRRDHLADVRDRLLDP